jgi:Hint domain
LLAKASDVFNERLFVLYSIWGGVVVNEPGIFSSNDQRTRRNVMKIGAILGAAALARVDRARAGPPHCVPVHFCLCLLRGTDIQTTAGQSKIEDLAIGDLLPTMFGGVRPIQWIGRYPVKKSDSSRPWAKAALPVRVARSAIAPEVPHADLYLTGWHALLIDGILIPAGGLINGTTITLHEAREHELEFFHIKMETHDAIYAEGVAVETLFEVDESAPNFAEYFRMYGVPETKGTRCAPVASYGGFGELKSRIRSAISPWVDRREPIDVIRDRLDERGIALSQQLEPSI